MESFPPGGLAVVVGASGAIGGALADAIESSGRFADVLRLGRTTSLPLDLLDEVSIVAAARQVGEHSAPLRLLINACGFLHDGERMPERSWRHLDPASLAHSFAINSIGPALLVKHFMPLFARDGKSVFAALSARVGSIGDNRLGGWYGYRASKAALNQILHTAAVELARSHPQSICIALHPGTVESGLSAPFARNGLDVQPPAVAASRLLAVIEVLTPTDSGGFMDYRGDSIVW
ncbi:MAG: C-factor [Betaproteobacteria bacterium HGW-Betaproteobacteria-13]|uniref:C-factor n=2 Tax=Parazoarcus communis TaxID=41977 RepID=A0A2U8H7V4_9RHOO|nr:C-factor [Parazoarcus communis]PKO81266.1 MAG: C-factor [Betaproteobacteria bacterium HGW-Betaproteobacteria-13]